LFDEFVAPLERPEAGFAGQMVSWSWCGRVSSRR